MMGQDIFENYFDIYLIQTHLYAKELYLSPWDSIDNYIEVKKENIV